MGMERGRRSEWEIGGCKRGRRRERRKRRRRGEMCGTGSSGKK